MKLYLSNLKYSKSLEDYVKVLEASGYKVSSVDLGKNNFDPNILVEVGSLEALLSIVHLFGNDLILKAHHKIVGAYTLVVRDH